MKVLKVELEGLTTSFRYPHFLVGRQPSFRMPPPATIYGHICSAVGEWIIPDSIKFSYCFFYAGRGDDLEHIHVTTVSHRKLDKKWGYVKNIEAEINPLAREILLFPKLVLYIDAQSQLNRLFDAFRSPRYAVILGRSQDLATYSDMSIVTLEKATQGYFENTLLPWSFRTRTTAGTSVLMPRFISPEDRRKVAWERYVILEHRIFYGISNEEKGVRTMLRYEDDEPLWIDPETPEIKNMKRAIIWHSFIGEETVAANFTSSE
jgi:CRISPR-associated protein Cas5t